jgi:hypothetical protein
MRWPMWMVNILEKVLPARKLEVFVGESLPSKLPWRNLVVLRDAGDDWSVGMRCPCGCGQAIELALIREAKPRWNLYAEQGSPPTLSPSIWLREGCHSHFFVRRGRVEWVRKTGNPRWPR